MVCNFPKSLCTFEWMLFGHVNQITSSLFITFIKNQTKFGGRMISGPKKSFKEKFLEEFLERKIYQLHSIFQQKKRKERKLWVNYHDVQTSVIAASLSKGNWNWKSFAPKCV